MEKFSVKKPFTILVAVIMILTLGYISVRRMSTDLLPEVDLPYIVVVAPYPGASPEKVESQISEPLENALGTISGVDNVYSVSSENYAMIQLEFEDGTDMDVAMVRTSTALNEAKASLPAGAGAPSMMEISMDMMATMYVAVNYEGADIYELTDYAEKTVIPAIERQRGVARVNTVGLVEKSVQVDLNQSKIDSLNDRILAMTYAALNDAKAQLDEAEARVNAGQAALEAQEKSFGSSVSSGIFLRIDEGAQAAANVIKVQAGELLVRLTELDRKLDEAASLQPDVNDIDKIDGLTDAQKQRLKAVITELQNIIQSIDGESYSRLMKSVTELVRAGAKIQAVLDMMDSSGNAGAGEVLSGAINALISLNGAMDQVPSLLDSLESGFAELTQAQLDAAVGFSSAASQLTSAQARLQNARAQYEAGREKAIANANADSLLTKDTLSKLIYAQNFSMPAGYIDDADDNSWLLKIGEEFGQTVDISDALLADIEGIGNIRITDVADVTIIDNSSDSYAKLNGSDGIILCIYKASTAGTNEVSRACRAELDKLGEADGALHYVDLVDQGSYITLIVRSILQSMITGALLAIVVLALFMREIRPTLVVGISIPLSVLFAVVLMYFSGLTLDIMTLSGLGLGIGMLVDNSIVVMENIFRLKTKGLPAARAAVYGAKQVRAPIISSTLTTVCVFMPMVFTTGYVRQLLIPLALAIGYCLMASLAVALTVVPASSSTIMKGLEAKPSRIFGRVLNRYGTMLGWCLSHRKVPLAAAILMFAAAIYGTVRSGVVLLPEMTTSDIQVNITAASGLTRGQSDAKADEIMAGIMKVDGVKDVGIMDYAGSTSLVSSISVNSGEYGKYMCYVSADENASAEDVHRICGEISAMSDDSAEVTATGSGMNDMNSLTSDSDLTVNLYGEDADVLAAKSDELVRMIAETDGFENVVGMTESGERALHLIIDRDKAMSCGLTVAQIYMQVASKLSANVTSTTVTIDGEDMKVVIRDDTDPVTVENLPDMEIEATDMTSAVSGAESSLSGELKTGSGLSSGLDSGSGSGLGGLVPGMTGSGEASAASGASSGEKHKLSEFATIEETLSPSSVSRENQQKYVTVTANTAKGYNTTLLIRAFRGRFTSWADSLPDGYSARIAGQTTQIDEMVEEMIKLMLVALLFVYLVMTAQFQSLLSPFIILFTVPLAFTGGMFALMICGEKLSMLSLMGFLILLGTVVNNGIVFVDYVNRLRIGGMKRHDALITTGKTRMRPILMTTLTTVLAMTMMVLGKDLGSQMGRGMAIVIVGGLTYATLMTLFIIPVMYDIFFRRPPLDVDVGEDIGSEYNEARDILDEAGHIEG